MLGLMRYVICCAGDSDCDGNGYVPRPHSGGTRNLHQSHPKAHQHVSFSLPSFLVSFFPLPKTNVVISRSVKVKSRNLKSGILPKQPYKKFYPKRLMSKEVL